MHEEMSIFAPIFGISIKRGMTTIVGNSDRPC